MADSAEELEHKILRLDYKNKRMELPFRVLNLILMVLIAAAVYIFVDRQNIKSAEDDLCNFQVLSLTVMTAEQVAKVRSVAAADNGFLCENAAGILSDNEETSAAITERENAQALSEVIDDLPNVFTSGEIHCTDETLTLYQSSLADTEIQARLLESQISQLRERAQYLRSNAQSFSQDGMLFLNNSTMQRVQELDRSRSELEIELQRQKENAYDLSTTIETIMLGCK